MRNRNRNRNPVTTESIFDEEYRLRQEALKLSKEHVDDKPIKYLIK